MATKPTKSNPSTQKSRQESQEKDKKIKEQKKEIDELNKTVKKLEDDIRRLNGRIESIVSSTVTNADESSSKRARLSGTRNTKSATPSSISKAYTSKLDHEKAITKADLETVQKENLKVATLEEEKSRLQTKVDKLENELAKLKEENETYRTELYRASADDDKHYKAYKRLKKDHSKKDQREKSAKTIDGRSQKLLEENKKLKEDLKNAKEKVNSMEKKYTELEESIQILRKQDMKGKEPDTVSVSNIQVEVGDKTLTFYEEQLSEFKMQKNEFEKEKLQGQQKIQDLENRVHKAADVRNRLQKEVEELTSSKDEFEKEKNEYEKEKLEGQQKIQDLENRVRKADEERKRLQKQIEELRNRTSTDDNQNQTAPGKSKDELIWKQQQEIDGLKNRLSQVAGSKLTDSNPAIADLSDPNRPLNLGEKFSELYDNQWTDAMEEMEQILNNENKAIGFLLQTVLEAYTFCIRKANIYLESMKESIKKLFRSDSNSQESNSLQLKLMKDHRKAMAIYLVQELQEEFSKKQETDKLQEKTVAYEKQCIAVCWFMAVQDPPVYIDSDDKVEGKPFDTDKYKHYTKTGKTAAYLVWPVLYLHKDGPMMGKGVAQGK